MCPAHQAPPARPSVEEWVPASPRSPGTAALTPGPPLTSAPSGASGFFLHWGFLPFSANSLCVSWFWVPGQRPGSGCCRAPGPPLPGGGPQALPLCSLTLRLAHGHPACRSSPLHSGLSLP